jgi:RNA polymerase sigma-70 factor (sigma-E family)
VPVPQRPPHDPSDDGFEDYVRGRSTALLRTAYLLTGDRGHAEDLLQSVLTTVARRWSTISQSPDAYVRRALANAAQNRWRRRRWPETTLDRDHASPQDAVAVVDLRDELVRGLRKLPGRQRAVLVLRYFEDLSEQETAATLGCSVGTVKSQSSRGLSRLRALVTAADPDDHPALAGVRTDS